MANALRITALLLAIAAVGFIGGCEREPAVTDPDVTEQPHDPEDWQRQ